MNFEFSRMKLDKMGGDTNVNGLMWGTVLIEFSPKEPTTVFPTMDIQVPLTNTPDQTLSGLEKEARQIAIQLLQVALKELESPPAS